MATPARRPKTVQEDLDLPQAPDGPAGVVSWLQRFVGQFLEQFRLHRHLFPSTLGSEMRVRKYLVATQPTAAQAGEGAIVFVSDAGAGAKFQGSTGAAWVNLG